MAGKAVSERVRRSTLGDPRFPDGAPHPLLKTRFMNMITPVFSRVWNKGQGLGWKEPLQGQLFGGIFVLFPQLDLKKHAIITGFHVFLVEIGHQFKVLFRIRNQGHREGRVRSFCALPS